MAFTNAEVLRMTELALQKHNVFSSGEPTPPPEPVSDVIYSDFARIVTLGGYIYDPVVIYSTYSIL